MGTAINEMGNRYGRLIVLERAGTASDRSATWLCKCDCGNRIVVKGTNLRRGSTRSCGCLASEMIVQVGHQYFENETGNRYSRLVVLGQAGVNKDRHILWRCQCDCGNVTVVSGNNLRQGVTKSCGCLKTLPFGVSAMRGLASNYRRRAKEKGHVWSLTEDEFVKLTSLPCFYCGILPSQVHRCKNCNGNYIYNGIDRVDNSKGYTFDNVVSCCGVCNCAKHTMTTSEFREWAERLYHHFVMSKTNEVNSVVD